jgi:hypothetical protein
MVKVPKNPPEKEALNLYMSSATVSKPSHQNWLLIEFLQIHEFIQFLGFTQNLQHEGHINTNMQEEKSGYWIMAD